MSDERDRISAEIMNRVISDRVSIDEAADRVAHEYRRFVSREAVRQIVTSLKSEMAGNRVLRHAVIDESAYQGSMDMPTSAMSGAQWCRYLDMLQRKNAFGIDELSRTTEEVCSLLALPNQPGARRKGLVMGNVQSGKTRHFSGVIARAVDMGYRFVIVLSGLYNNLREQTQSRLDRDLFVDREFWYHLTSAENNDFDRRSELLALMGSHSDVRLCAVVKKNKTRLKNLEASLRNVPEEIRRKCPILIIDDEADQATLNSEKEKKKISAINAVMRRIWDLIPSGSYVAYTATPFANVLMDPDDEADLFPSDFVYTLTAGDGYLGAEQVFGLADADVDGSEPAAEGPDLVRIIPAKDSWVLKPPSKKLQRESFDPEPPSSLISAVRWFVVASAVRRARGYAGHSSMLVHTTHYTAPHFAMRERFLTLVQRMRREVEFHREAGLAQFYESWRNEHARVAAPAGRSTPEWDAVAEQLPDVLRNIEVIVDNGVSEDRLNYDAGRPRTVIVVGGGTLSRGLTLEGLVVSYFTRSSNTYDTLMQMGRWFGYRSGYEDLLRIWVADGLDRDYAFLALVEKDLRDEIRSVEDSEYTPRQVGVKVRCHPGRLEITSAGKMANARLVRLSMSNARQQTFIMDGRPDATRRNLRAVERLLSGCEPRPLRAGGRRWIVRGIDTRAIIGFLQGYSFHPDQRIFSDPDLRGATIDWLMKYAQERSWNIILAGNSMPGAMDSLGVLPVAGIRVPMLRRTPLRGSTVEKLNFKAIMSSADRLADIEPEAYADMPNATDAQRMVIRRRLAGGDGLVMIYPISHRSKNKLELTTRMDMPQGVGEDLLGFSIVYPAVDHSDAEYGNFVSVKPLAADVDVGEPEEDDDWEDEE